MSRQRMNVAVAESMKRALKASGRRRGSTTTRTVNAALLHYLRLTPHQKLAAMIALHDWELEKKLRREWKDVATMMKHCNDR